MIFLRNVIFVVVANAADYVSRRIASRHRRRQLRHLDLDRDVISWPEVAHDILHHASCHCR